MNELYVFTTATDWVIASNKQDAIKVWNEHYGDDYNDYGDHTSWRQLDETETLTIGYDLDDSDESNLPSNAQVTEKDGRILVTCSPQAWVIFNGRGFLCSTEW